MGHLRIYGFVGHQSQIWWKEHRRQSREGNALSYLRFSVIFFAVTNSDLRMHPTTIRLVQQGLTPELPRELIITSFSERYPSGTKKPSSLSSSSSAFEYSSSKLSSPSSLSQSERLSPGSSYRATTSVHHSFSSSFYLNRKLSTSSHSSSLSTS
jgi:hypothetical protein